MFPAGFKGEACNLPGYTSFETRQEQNVELPNILLLKEH